HIMVHDPYSYLPSFTSFCFLFKHPPPTEISTLSLHDALPIFADRKPRCASRATSGRARAYSALRGGSAAGVWAAASAKRSAPPPDRKSTRLNSSHVKISYAVFCLKKKKNIKK